MRPLAGVLDFRFLINYLQPTVVGPETRSRLRTLDACLHEVEDARERGDERVSAELATKLRRHVTLEKGSLLGDAHEKIFRLQDASIRADHRDLPYSNPSASDAGAGPKGLLTEEEARVVTERIRRNLKQISLLLLEAHDRKAWVALSYHSWHAYAKHEFGMSRSRSYEILEQARVVLDLQFAAGLRQPPVVSAHAASQIKPHVQQIAAEIRRRRAEGSSSSPEGALRVAYQVINETRHKLRLAQRATAASGSRPTLGLVSPVSDAKLRSVISYLGALPDPAEYIQRTAAADLPDPDAADRALAWLSDFVDTLHDLQQRQSAPQIAKGA
jgi:hypothetical protein